jgi:hypothetical protein
MRRHWKTALETVGLCAFFFGQVSAQTPGRNVNMVAGTDWPGGDPFLQRQNEPSIAVSTRNPCHLLAGANDYRTVDLPGLPGGQVTGDAWLGLFKSFDCGRRWQSTLLRGYPQDQTPEGIASPLHGFEAGADPTVRAAHNGLFYYSGIVFDRGTNGDGAVFVARFIDLNNKEGASFDVASNRDPIRPLGEVLVGTGTSGQFIDKPWLAVDVPRAGAATCSVDVAQPDGTRVTQTFPGGNAYLAYAIVLGSESNVHTKIMFTRSTDCGASWSNPQSLKLSESLSTNQGASIAVDPRNGHVYVAWRQFKDINEPDAIVIAKSTDGGRSFAKASRVATIVPFEQGSTLTSFRTTMFTTAAADGDGRVYLAWSDRVGPSGDGRIVVTSSADGGASWSTPTPIEGPAETAGRRGHQFMPSLTFNQGKLVLAFYDQRLDHTVGTLVCPSESCADISQFVEERQPAGDLAPPAQPAKVFTEFLTDSAPPGLGPLQRRHTIDVFVAQADPAHPPAFAAPVRVSQYAFGSRRGETLVEQMQYNPPNFPLFRQGTAGFIGDYIDIVGAPSFVRASDGTWQFNSGPSCSGDCQSSASFHVAWTDNRDVRPPADGNWSNYTPVVSPALGTASVFDPTQNVPACVPGQTGMRNQNIYTSRIAEGLVVGTLQNTKRLGRVPHPDPSMGGTLDIQRSFVVFAQNATDSTRHYRLSIVDPAAPPSGFQSSFLQFETLKDLDVSIAARSSISRTVFVISPEDPKVSVTVEVAEIAAPGAPVLLPAGFQDRVIINPDPTAPDILNPDIFNPDIINPDILNAEIYNPDILNPDILNPDILNPDITNPDITNPDILNPDIFNPDIVNPDILNPDILNPDITNPDILNPDITNPDILNGAIRDVTWTVTNNGNTSAAYDVNLLLNGEVPEGSKLQLIVHKVYLNPVALGCSLERQTTNVLVASIPRPELAIDPEDLARIDPTNPDVKNATLSLAPGETGKITLRFVGADASTADRIVEDGLLVPGVVSQAANTATTNTPSAAPLTILTNSLPDGSVGVAFSKTFMAIGGVAPLSWSVSAGDVPPGLSLDAATGALSGVPSTSGTFDFTVRLVDSRVPPRTDVQRLTHRIKGRPDLVVAAGAPAIQPSSVLPGESFELRPWSLRNQGESDALSPSGNVSSGFYLSTDAIITAGDVRLGGALAADGDLQAGEQADFGAATLTVPSGTAPGDYFIGILVDETDLIVEANEANNFASTALTVSDPNAGALGGRGTATIDGVLSPGEWNNAGRIDFEALDQGGPTPATLFVMNDAVNLYLAVRYAQGRMDSGNSLTYEFDNDGDGLAEEGDDVLFFKPGTGFVDRFRSSAKPCKLSGPAACTFDDAKNRGKNDGAGAFRADGTFAVYEFSHPLDTTNNAHDFSLQFGDRPGLFLTLHIVGVDGKSRVTEFPGFRSYLSIVAVTP